MPETPPNGCAHCGLSERDHFRRWTDAAGWHGYVTPTDAQRLERMRARRTPPAPSAATAPKRGLAATETPATPPPGVIGPANTPEALSEPRTAQPEGAS